jgi:hypothetical protein
MHNNPVGSLDADCFPESADRGRSTGCNLQLSSI